MKLLGALLVFSFAASAADFSAGVATLNITPERPIYLSGYANRNHPSEGKFTDLYAKALAIKDAKGGRVVIVTTDLIGLPRTITDEVGARVEKNFNLKRAALLLNSSHTHSGPAIARNLETMFDWKPEERAEVEAYSRKLTDTLVTLVGKALDSMQPATLSLGNGEAHFAINRREPTAKGIRIGLNPKGPTDPDVPVLKIAGADGHIMVALFGYACHNTTLGGDFYRVNGDYAAFAQSAFEKQHPGATAMFLLLCAGDQNPNPRGKPELAEQHGNTLAAEVSKVLTGSMRRIQGRIQADYRIIDLAFAHHTRETFEQRAQDKNVWIAKNARNMLKTYEEGHPIRTTPYPIQLITIGKDFTLLALGGEVVVDYCLRVKREYGARGMIVAAYSNDVMSYIPTVRVLKEGGYEAVDSMTYYGMPGPYDESVEERIFKTIHQMMQKAGRKSLPMKNNSIPH